MDKVALGFFAIVACFIVVILVQPQITGQAIYGKYDLTVDKYVDVEELDEAEEDSETSEEEVIEETEDVEMIDKELYEKATFNPDLYKPKFDLGKIDPVEPEDSDSDTSCCIDPQAVDALIDQVEELQEKVAQMEERNNQQCTPVTISRGSCQDTCQSESLRCTASLYRREVTERSIFGDTTSELFSTIDDCDDDWYFPNDPDVTDTRTCVCC